MMFDLRLKCFFYFSNDYNARKELLTLSENRKSEFILGFARLVLRTLYNSRVVFCRLLFVPLAFGHCTVTAYL
jgi:hypothetical protein